MADKLFTEKEVLDILVQYRKTFIVEVEKRKGDRLKHFISINTPKQWFHKYLLKEDRFIDVKYQENLS